MIKKKSLSNYLNYSKNHISSFVFLLPLLIIYEFIHFYKFYDLNYEIRNSADKILRDIFKYIFNDYFHYYTFLIILILLIIYFNNYKKIHSFIIKPKYLFLMYIEGLILGYLLVYILNDYQTISYLSESFYNDIFFLFYMSLGAGIWEEFLFRFLFISLFLFLLTKVFNKNIFNTHICILLSAIIFSLFHYIGYSSETFQLYSFIIRFLGGLILGYIYIIRGLGIASMTHFCYDLFLISFPLI